MQKWFANVTHRVVHNEYYRLLNACKHMRYDEVNRHQMNRLLRAKRYSSAQIIAIDNVAYEFFKGHQPTERHWRKVLASTFWQCLQEEVQPDPEDRRLKIRKGKNESELLIAIQEAVHGFLSQET